MKSGRQRRRELQDARKEKARQEALARVDAVRARPEGAVKVSHGQLVRFNSYGPPDWYQRGYYVDTPFRCVDCGVEQVWTATQQKWWYEVAKGQPFSFAKRCRACRRRKRETKGLARTRAGR